MVKITEPMFEGNPEDELHTVEPYVDEPAADPEAKNTLKTKLLNFRDSVSEKIDSALGRKKELEEGEKQPTKKEQASNLLKKARNTATKVKDGMEYKDRIEGALKGNDRYAIRNIMDELSERMAAGSEGISKYAGIVNKAGKIMEMAMFTKDGIETLKNDKHNTFSTMFGLLESINNGAVDGFLDLGVQSALLGEMLNTLHSMPGAVDFLDNLFRAKLTEDGDWMYGYPEEFRWELGRTASNFIDGTTELEFIDKMIDHVGASSLLTENPNLPIDIISKYVFPYGMLPEELEEGKEIKTRETELALLIKVLTRLKSDWFTAKRNGSPAWNLYFISHASEDATELLMLSETHMEAMLTAPYYKPSSFRELTENLYPDLAF